MEKRRPGRPKKEITKEQEKVFFSEIKKHSLGEVAKILKVTINKVREHFKDQDFRLIALENSKLPSQIGKLNFQEVLKLSKKKKFVSNSGKSYSHDIFEIVVP